VAHVQAAVSLTRALPGATADEVQRLADLAGNKVVHSGDLVFQQGDSADALYVVTSGYLKVSVSSPTTRTQTIGLLSPGEMFGETALVDGGPREITVTAVTRAELVCIARPSFQRLLETSPEVATAIMNVLARRLRALSEQSDDYLNSTVSARLAKQLLRLSGSQVRTKHAALRLPLKISQSDLGEMVGATDSKMFRRCSTICGCTTWPSAFPTVCPRSARPMF
jgi:CRP/FNR family cyclic AMP-dependent transcriptional regulator